MPLARQKLALPLLLVSAFSLALAEERSLIEPEALQAVEQVLARVAGAETLSVKISDTVEVSAQGMRQEMDSTFELYVERPNKFAFIGTSGMMANTVVSDGETLSTLFVALRRYTVSEAPETVAAHFSAGGGAAAMAGGSGGLVLGALFADGEVRQAIREAQTVQTQEDGTRTITLLLAMPRLWEENGEINSPEFLEKLHQLELPVVVTIARKDDQPVLRAVEAEMTPLLRVMAGEQPELRMFEEMRIRTRMTFTDWTFDEEISAERFTFTPPPGVERVESVREAIAGAAETEAPSPQTLIGQPAPSFTLPLLNGGELDLSRDLGEKVIVLDFWATWCPPCIRALPILMETTAEFAEAGVVFYAINVREQPERVQSFLREREWETLAVPMDRQGTVAEKYLVSGIPQTVLIGRDGRVEAVHIGFAPDLRQRLTAELAVLTEGGTLAAEPPPDETGRD